MTSLTLLRLLGRGPRLDHGDGLIVRDDRVVVAAIGSGVTAITANLSGGNVG